MRPHTALSLLVLAGVSLAITAPSAQACGDEGRCHSASLAIARDDGTQRVRVEGIFAASRDRCLAAHRLIRRWAARGGGPMQLDGYEITVERRRIDGRPTSLFTAVRETPKRYLYVYWMVKDPPAPRALRR